MERNKGIIQGMEGIYLADLEGEGGGRVDRGIVRMLYLTQSTFPQCLKRRLNAFRQSK